MRKITVLDFANQIGVLSDEVPVIVKTDRKVIGRFRCLYEIPETAMPGFGARHRGFGRARSEDRPCHSAIRRDYDSGQAESSHDLNRY